MLYHKNLRKKIKEDMKRLKNSSDGQGLTRLIWLKYLFQC